MSKETLPRVEAVELSFEVVVDNAWIDRNNHVNNARYLDIYERARAGYLESVCGVSVEEFERDFGLRAVVAGPFNGFFGGQLFPGEQLTVLTAAQSESRRINFSQRIAGNEQEGNEFHCRVYLIDYNNVPKRVPDEVRNGINQAGFK